MSAVKKAVVTKTAAMPKKAVAKKSTKKVAKKAVKEVSAAKKAKSK